MSRGTILAAVLVFLMIGLNIILSKKKKNYINLDVNNFNITDKGDLVDMVNYQSFNNVNALEDGTDNVLSMLE